jgi:hypothetical protein
MLDQSLPELGNDTERDLRSVPDELYFSIYPVAL